MIIYERVYVCVCVSCGELKASDDVVEVSLQTEPEGNLRCQPATVCLLTTSN